MHKEKVSRREIGVFTSVRRLPRGMKVLPPASTPAGVQKRPTYSRQPINFQMLDHLGHGVKVRLTRRKCQCPFQKQWSREQEMCALQWNHRNKVPHLGTNTQTHKNTCTRTAFVQRGKLWHSLIRVSLSLCPPPLPLCPPTLYPPPPRSLERRTKQKASVNLAPPSGSPLFFWSNSKRIITGNNCVGVCVSRSNKAPEPEQCSVSPAGR